MELRSTRRSQSSSGRSMKDLKYPKPALFISSFTVAPSAFTRSSIFSMELSCVRSSARQRVPVCRVPASSFSLSSRLATSQSSSRSYSLSICLANSAPKPLDAPVIIPIFIFFSSRIYKIITYFLIYNQKRGIIFPSYFWEGNDEARNCNRTGFRRTV